MTMVLAQGETSRATTPMARLGAMPDGLGPMRVLDRRLGRSLALSLVGHAIVVAILSSTTSERTAPPRGGETPIDVQLLLGAQESAFEQAAPGDIAEAKAQEMQRAVAAPDEPPLAEAAPVMIPATAPRRAPLREVEPPRKIRYARASHSEASRAREETPLRGGGGEGRGERHNSASARGGQLGSAAAAGTAESVNYRALALAHLARFKQYPNSARDRNVIGSTVVRFTVSPHGDVLFVALVRSSGAAMLDDATLAMVRRASPFPAMPNGSSTMTISAGVNYNLR